MASRKPLLQPLRRRLHFNLMENPTHLGDGVYATFDGFGIELRVNDHRNPVAVYLEPDVLNSLNRWYGACKDVQPTSSTSAAS